MVKLVECGGFSLNSMEFDGNWLNLLELGASSRSGAAWTGWKSGLKSSWSICAWTYFLFLNYEDWTALLKDFLGVLITLVVRVKV